MVDIFGDVFDFWSSPPPLFFVSFSKVADSFPLLNSVTLKIHVFRETLTQEIFFARQLGLIGLHRKCDI